MNCNRLKVTIRIIMVSGFYLFATAISGYFIYII